MGKKSRSKTKRAAVEVENEDMQVDEGEADGEENEEYVVEKILDKRVHAGRTEYLLKWKGYSSLENTWEPEDNLDCFDLLAEFNKHFEQRAASKKKNKTLKSDESASSTDEARKRKAENSKKKSPVKRKRNTPESQGNGDAEQDEASDEGPIGFERGLEAEKIIGATDATGELYFLMKWKDTEIADLVPAKEANVKCPQIVIRFYEERVTWCRKDDGSSNAKEEELGKGD